MPSLLCPLYQSTPSVPPGYTVTTNPPSSLAASASGSFAVRLDSATTGTKSGSISFSNNDGNENPFNFPITGRVDAPPPEITVLLGSTGITDGQSTAIDFGSVVQGQTGITKVFTVRNDGGSTLTLGSVSVPSGYTVTTNPPSSLAASASGSFAVRLDTATTGTKSGTLSFTNNDSNENPFNFPITGVVTVPPIGTVTVTVRNGQSAGSPAVPGAVVQWYTNSASGWVLQRAQTNDANGQTTWTVPANVGHFFEAYYVNPTFGSGGNNPPFQPSQDQPEFWGAIGPVTVGGGTTVTTNLYRTEPVVAANDQTPWLGTVTVQRTDTGAMLPPGETVVAGTPLWFQFNVRNNAGATKESGARLFLDRDKTAPIDQNLNGGLTFLASGGTTVFGFAWTPQAAYAGDYYSAPRAKVRLANGNTWTSDSWAWSSTPLVRVVASAPPKGITVITHGWQLGTPFSSGLPPDWAFEMAAQVLGRADGFNSVRNYGSIFFHNQTSGEWNPAPTTKTGRSNSDNPNEEIVLIYNWFSESDTPQAGWLEAAAENLFASLLLTPSPLGTTRLLTPTRPYHFIGHSRGAVLNSLVTSRIGHYFPLLTIDQVTTLDPHPAQGFYADPDILTFNNIVWADNYWRSDNNYTIDFNGQSVPGARNVQLVEAVLNDEGDDVPPSHLEHSDVHAWYRATIDPVTTHLTGLDVDTFKAQNWWTAGIAFLVSEESNSGRANIGYAYSRVALGTGRRPASYQGSRSTPTAPQSIYNGSFDRSSTFGIPGWERHGGSISSDTQVSVDGSALALKGLGAKATHNRFFIPANVTHLLFDSRVVNPSVILSVSIDSTSLGSFMLTAATDDFPPYSLPIPSALRDSVHTLTFEITQAWSQTTQLEEVRIDNVRVASLADTTKPTVAISSPATGTTYTNVQTVAIAATASDNVGVTRVEFYDGATNKFTDTSSPYSYNWPITAADNGAHSWTARAYDAAGNVSTSSVVTLTVNIINPPPAPTANSATSITSSGFTANWSSASGATGYRLDVSASSSFSSFVTGYNDLDVGNALLKSVSGLSASTPYYYRVRAYNAGGTSANSATIPVTTASPASRIISVSGNLAFGDATVGSTAQRTLTISNAGNSTLNVSGISYPSGFSGDWANGPIATGSSTNVTVTFAPTAVGSYGGSVTVNSDATSGVNTISASGTAWPCPQLIYPTNMVWLSPDEITVSVNVYDFNGCTWSASTSESWMHIVSGSSGIGNGTVTYRMNANTNSAPRAGVVNIGAWAHQVSQAGASSPNSPQLSIVQLGGQVQISWPVDFLGWTLESQTASATSGLGTNWVAVPGSSVVNSLTLPMNPSGATFYRLHAP